jgi:hypothetical protein
MARTKLEFALISIPSASAEPHALGNLTSETSVSFTWSLESECYEEPHVSACIETKRHIISSPYYVHEAMDQLRIVLTHRRMKQGKKLPRLRKGL